jgi:hypothetical protein
MAVALIGLAALGAVLGGIDLGKHMKKAPKKAKVIRRLLIYDFLLSLLFPHILASAIFKAENLSYGGAFFYLDVIMESFKFYAMAFVMKALCFAVPSAFFIPLMTDSFFIKNVTNNDKEKALDNIKVTDIDTLFDNINNT